nr:hypothetical protein [Tanacetum cinerariifolium]
TAKDQHRHLKRSGETLESSESKTLKSSYSTTQPTELHETTSVFAGATIAAGDPIPSVTSISADDLEVAFKRYLRQPSDNDEPAEPVSLALVSNIT